MKEMEDFYAVHFCERQPHPQNDMFTYHDLVHGDKKKTLHRLRGATSQKTHHLSIFKSGALLGFAVPPLMAGLYLSAYNCLTLRANLTFEQVFKTLRRKLYQDGTYSS